MRPAAAAVSRAGIAAAYCAVSLLLGCHNEQQRTAQLRVVATIQPLASIVSAVLGERGEVVTLLPPGASPHTFEPLPGDMVRLRSAAMLLRVGHGVDDWSVRLLSGAATPARTIALLELPGLELLPWPGARGHDGAGAVDPHAWLDPLRVRDTLVPALADALGELDADGAEVYRQRARELAVSLGELDTSIRRQLAGAASRKFIAYHDTWRYFAGRYGLSQVASIETYAGDEPTAAELAGLVALARSQDVSAVMMEPQLGGRVARNVASELGASLETVDPLGDPTNPARATYTGMMEFNAAAFARALGASPP